MSICAHYMKYLVLILSLIFLSSCKTTTQLTSISQVEQLVKKVQNNPEDVVGVIEQTKRSKQAIKSDLAAIKALFKELEAIVNKEWGVSETELPSQKKYVKYSNDYQARAIVDFGQGSVTVETIATDQTSAKLKQAIVTTLLTPADPSTNDIFSDQSPALGAEPFLYNQVLDQDSKPIRYQWRANRFADHLLKERRSKRRAGGKVIHKVQFSLVKDHTRFRQLQFSEYVLASSKKYNIKPDLIYAIIETESSFNPYAVSHANAYGLMQVVPATAGRDVYSKLKKRSDQPTKATLFNPKHNIDIGTGYLSILQRNYLAKIRHLQNKEYAVISAYNGGAGNVLKTFHSSRTKAISNINQLKPESVYWALTTKHPKLESRNYLKKVKAKQAKY